MASKRGCRSGGESGKRLQEPIVHAMLVVVAACDSKLTVISGTPRLTGSETLCLKCLCLSVRDGSVRACRFDRMRNDSRSVLMS